MDNCKGCGKEIVGKEFYMLCTNGKHIPTCDECEAFMNKYHDANVTSTQRALFQSLDVWWLYWRGLVKLAIRNGIATGLHEFEVEIPDWCYEKEVIDWKGEGF